MGLYAGRDLAITVGGDVEVASNGDLKLASEPQTVAQHASFLIRTDRGDYRPDARLGCNLGTLIGLPNTQETKVLAKSYVREELDEHVFFPQDYFIKLAALDIYTLFLLVKAKGTFLNSDNQFSEQEVVLTFEYPYLDRAPEPIGELWQ